MTFEECLDQTIAMLHRQGRVSYRALKRQFGVDDAYLSDLKHEIVDIHRVAVDQDGVMLVWLGVAVGGETVPTVEPTLRSSQGASPAESREPAGPAAERRQLTVMFCDVVDSTALSAQLDPEELHEVLRVYHQTTAAAVERFGGFIAQYLGDGLLAYFGFPQAHEDDAQRAVRAGLAILKAMKTLPVLEVRNRAPLAVRIGIHTGPVVVGEIGAAGSRQEQLALGETPNVAARIQGLATPDSVLVTAATWRLVEGYFTSENLGPQSLKGLSQPIVVHRMLDESGAQSRLDVTAPGALTPVVGRDSEVRLLLERWAQAKDGLGHLVLLTGEAGIGKSRLVALLREHVRTEGAARITFRCSPYHTNSAFYPVIEHLERLLEFQRDDSADAKLAKIERMLAGFRFTDATTVPLFAALLSVPLPEGRYPPPRMSPQHQRQRTYEALTTWLIEEAERRPLLAVYEDLHWADPSTLEALSFLIDQIPTARLLVVFSSRPEFRPPWSPRSHLSSLTLSRFSRGQAETMIAEVARGKTLPAEVVKHVVEKTDGVPLFVEELLKMVLESGLLREEPDRYVLTGPLPALAIPTTLQDSLMARLDRFAAARATAQVGSVLGRQFSQEVLRAVAQMDETTLAEGLAQLVDAELIYRRGHGEHTTYVFKHALVRDAAYQSLLKSRRHFYHARIARTLEARFPELPETQPELLAHHHAEAGDGEAAIQYRQKAAQRAIERSANAEAINHLRIALEIVRTLPDTPARLEQELLIQTMLGPALTTTMGFGALEVEQAYGRAHELCRQVGQTEHRARVLNGLWSFYLVRARYGMAREVAQELLQTAERSGTPLRLLEAHRAIGVTLLYTGELVDACAHLESGLAIYDPRAHRALAARYGVDLAVSCLSFVAWGWWLRGYPDRARARSEEMLRIAADVAHPYSQAWAFTFAAWVHQLRREPDLAHARAGSAIALAAEHGFSLFLALATKFRGWALAARGNHDEGITDIEEAIAAYRETGAESSRTHWLTLLAEAYGRAERTSEGLAALTEAMDLVDKYGERYYEAEIHRLRGELLLRSKTPPHVEAEACFQRAREIAHRQHATGLELRAVLSLGRLWQHAGTLADARALVRPVYEAFTEGHDTVDLQESRALLDALA